MAQPSKRNPTAAGEPGASDDPPVQPAAPGATDEPGGPGPAKSHTELKVAAAALAAAASAPLGVAVAAGAALSSPDVRSALRRATVKAVAGAMQAADQVSAAVGRRAAPAPPREPSDPSR